MFLDFSQNIEKSINFAHDFQPGEIDLGDETAELAGELKIAGTARQREAGAEVTGKISGDLEIACHRCLKSIRSKIEIEFADDFITLASYEQSRADNHEVAGADLDVSVYDGERIDVKELVREQILLNLPAQQLCEDSCRGLCETCGANKNNDDCSCADEIIDPRWKALEELRSKN